MSEISNILMDEISIYIHWPFCKSKCPYCDFNSHVRETIDEQAFQAAYLDSLNNYLEYFGNKKISSIFFGGGTPSLAPVKIIENIIAHIANKAKISDQTEITLEANPTSSEAKKFEFYKSVGVNRLSIGVQAFNQDDLKFLGREHSSNEAISAIESAAKYFDNYSFDLIYARPNQSVKNWEQELQFALSLANKHLSLYQLTIEKGTKFFKMYKEQQFKLPNQELAYELYNATIEMLAKKGLARYEISNFAIPGYESKHNLCYWQYKPYLGVGPGAHSRLWANNKMNGLIMTHNPEAWLKKNLQSSEIISENQLIEEAIMMGVRLAEGINLSAVKTRYGIDLISKLNSQKLKNLADNQLLSIENQHLRLTNQGMLVANKIIEFLLAS